MEMPYIDDRQFCLEVRKLILEYSPKPEDLTFTRNYILNLVEKALRVYTDKTDLLNTFQAEFICGMIMASGDELGRDLFSELVDMITERDYELAYKDDKDFFKSEFACKYDENDKQESIDLESSSDPELDYMLFSNDKGPKPPPNSPNDSQAQA